MCYHKLLSLLGVAMIGVGAAQYAVAAPSDWYATMDRNITDLNASYRKQGDKDSTWTRKGDKLILSTRVDDRFGATARADPKRASAIVKKVLMEKVCDPDARWIDALGVGFVIAQQLYDNKGLVAEAQVRLDDCPSR